LDSLKGLETLKYLGQSVKHVYKINKVSEKYREATVKTLRIAFLSSFALDFFTSLSIAFVAVGLGFRLIDGAMVLFPALSILLLAPEYFSPIKQVGSDFHATLDGQVAMTEIDTIIEADEKTQGEGSKTPLVWQSKSHIELLIINVLNKGFLILLDINYAWHGFRLIGVFSESGAGKSTFINFLASFL